jgi:hypothetical protein
MDALLLTPDLVVYAILPVAILAVTVLAWSMSPQRPRRFTLERRVIPAVTIEPATEPEERTVIGQWGYVSARVQTFFGRAAHAAGLHVEIGLRLDEIAADMESLLRELRPLDLFPIP